MLKKSRISRNNIVDKLHRGMVYMCIGVTVGGTFMLGARLWNYYMYEKPERKRLELKMLEERALADKEDQLNS